MFNFQRHFCADVPTPAGCPRSHTIDQPCHNPTKIWNKALTLLLLENQTCPCLQKAPDPSTLKDIFKWYFQMAIVIWSAFLHNIPKGKFTPGVCAFLEQQNANRAKVWFLSTGTNSFEWILARLSFASFSESIICSNVTDDTEEVKCGWGDGRQALESAPLPAGTLSQWLCPSRWAPKSQLFTWKMGMMITTIAHRPLEV